jgi:predicted RNase H-like HicB family nuclease
MKSMKNELLTELNLTAIYEEAEEVGYIGYVAELPCANTQGEATEEVCENLREAVQMILEVHREEAERRLAKGVKVVRENLTLRMVWDEANGHHSPC